MRVVRRTAPVLLGAVMGLAGAVLAADEEPVATPTFTVVQSTIDLGKIRAGDTATAVFGFINSGDAEVRILHAKPS